MLCCAQTHVATQQPLFLSLHAIHLAKVGNDVVVNRVSQVGLEVLKGALASQHSLGGWGVSA